MPILFRITIVSLFLIGVGNSSRGEDLSTLRGDIQAFKTDPRGPYQSIRWFCPDGTILPAQERCLGSGGQQHALPKQRVTDIATDHGIYLGQILAGEKFGAIFDRERSHSRIKQYQIERFLRITDDGWIHRRARYYRGAIQAEDEETWGRDFLAWLVAQDDVLEKDFFLARQIARDVPHSGEIDRSTRVRALAKEISDLVPEFMNLRIKIHGRPDASDVQRVDAFWSNNEADLSPLAREKIHELAEELGKTYRKPDASRLARYVDNAPVATPIGRRLGTALSPGSSQPELVELLWSIRAGIRDVPVERRLAMLDLSIDVERLLLTTVPAPPRTLEDLVRRNFLMAKASVGCGFIELWEWEHLRHRLGVSEVTTSTELLGVVDAARRAVAWGAQMVSGVYGPDVGRFAQFEPLSRGFIDERVRASILLRFGEAADRLFESSLRFSGQTYQLMDLSTRAVRGLNPGYALGDLSVHGEVRRGDELSPDKIYVLPRAPEDLEPVAGIATVSEGNAVSHVQLLARNLGIPNATLSLEQLHALAPYSGTRVFYAVSPGGSVVMKPANAMSDAEAALFASPEPSGALLHVPVEKLSLEESGLLELSELRVSDSGVLCGPKAAHLAQLSRLFPENVPKGLVIPFGAFYQHLRQPMPGSNTTYWDALTRLFAADSEVEPAGSIDELSAIRASIRSIPFLPGFSENLRTRFAQSLGRPMGALRVFVRSDTNMEDLESFTGAGLNLTVAHIQDEREILQAVRDVWASPFTERSYRWRRSVLDNPTAVYPSVLLIPSVHVDKSGVLVTSTTSSGEMEDLIVATNWGGAGAVNGQSAETYRLHVDGRDVLLSPSREPRFQALPLASDIETRSIAFHRPILSHEERLQVRGLARRLSSHFDGPLDVEFGFQGGQLWLFQVRPFVQNEQALASSYLRSLDRKPPEQRISLDTLLAPTLPSAVR